MEPTTQEIKPRVSPADFFLHLGIIVTLYISSVSLLSLLFQVINRALPDRLNQYYSGSGTQEGILMATAFLIIMFPLYIFLGWLYNRQLTVTPEKKQLGIRKWLTYFTLFIAGLTLAIDLAIVVFYFLNGEISTRFILKALSVIVVAGLIFAYYILDVLRSVENRKTIFRAFGAAAVILVVGSIVTSFAIIGTPQSQRKLRFDERRVNDLTNVQWQVISYWQRKNELPQSLQNLQDPITGYQAPNDPETNVAYEYRKTGDLSFEICANFATDSSSSGSKMPPSISYPDSNENSNWNHGVGRQCFNRTIDPDLYPKQQKTVTQ